MRLTADLVKAQIGALLTEYPSLIEDEELRTDMLEGETSLSEFASQLVREIGEIDAMAEGLATYRAELGNRIMRFEMRVDMRRELLLKLMELGHVSKLTLPEATVSVRAKPRAIQGEPIVEELPDDLVVLKRSPDRKAIKAALEAGRAVPGCALDNGGVSLSIRRA